MNKKENLDVLLINMPFGSLLPSLSLSLLKGAVKKKGYSSIIKYYNLKFTRFIGETNNLNISNGRPVYNYLLGEWLFSRTLFDNLPPDEEYIKEILNKNLNEQLDPKIFEAAMKSSNLIPELKSKAEPFLNSCLKEIISIRPKIVGFSSTFQQNIASISLAKRIKKNLPETTIVFGGANCEGEMGLEMIKKFPFIDIIVSGEADETFPELVSKIINKEEYLQIPGVICQQNLHLYSNGVINSPMVLDMDSLPILDYDDYFEQIKTYDIKDNTVEVYLLFESSRGCWWGEKSHCTFCGFNGNNMLHRSKSASRVLDEIKFLNDKYKVRHFMATDNILDMSYFKDFVPALANENMDLSIFYEVKANLNKEQVKLLKKANIDCITAGIESLSTHVLDIMKKGIKSIQNVQLLKWCKEFGIKVDWVIISGFPGEKTQDYLEMVALIPKISHLTPPLGVSPLRLDRFSPNFNFPEKFGIKKVIPYPSYKYIFPFEEESIYNLAYFFDYEYEPDDNFSFALNTIKEYVYKWIDNRLIIDLFFIDREDTLIVYDLRGLSKEYFFILQSKERFLYLLCDKIQPLAKIKKEYIQHFNLEANDTEISEILDSLINRNLMIRENNSFLSLALPLGNYSPSKEIINKLAALLKVRPAGVGR